MPSASAPSASAAGFPACIRVSPHGKLIYESVEPADDVAGAAAETFAIAAAFADGQAAGLIHLAGLPDSVGVPPDVAYFRGCARKVVDPHGSHIQSIKMRHERSSDGVLLNGCPSHV